MDGWKTIVSFGDGLFLGAMLASGRITKRLNTSSLLSSLYVRRLCSNLPPKTTTPQKETCIDIIDLKETIETKGFQRIHI